MFISSSLRPLRLIVNYSIFPSGVTSQRLICLHPNKPNPVYPEPNRDDAGSGDPAYMGYFSNKSSSIFGLKRFTGPRRMSLMAVNL